MDGLLCLKWNNHSSAFLKKLSKLRGKELYCDATIICHERFFPVHRLVLSTCSDYFEEIFDKIQCKHPFIIVKEIEPRELEALLNYMYKGEVNVLQELLPGLIRAAESLKIKGLAVPDDDDGDKDARVSSRKEKRTHPSSPSPQYKRTRRLENKNFCSGSSSKKLNYKEPELIVPKSEPDIGLNIESTDKSAGNDSDNFVSVGIGNSNSSSREEDRVNNVELQNVKLEPVEDIDTGDDDPHEDSLLEFPYEESSTTKEENFISTETDSTFQHEQQPQCSSWDDILPPAMEGGESQPNLEGMQDEIYEVITASNHNRENQDTIVRPDIPTERKKKGSNDSVRIFSCCYCSYGTPFQSALKEHIYTHTGERPFRCHLCPYKTVNTSNLKKHIRIHTNEKPFKCQYCSYAAKQKVTLRNHMIHRHAHVSIA